MKKSNNNLKKALKSTIFYTCVVMLLVVLSPKLEAQPSKNLEAEFVPTSVSGTSLTLKIRVKAPNTAFILGDCDSLKFRISNTGAIIGLNSITFLGNFTAYTVAGTANYNPSTGYFKVKIAEGTNSNNLTTSYEDFVSIVFTSTGTGNDLTNVTWLSTNTNFEQHGTGSKVSNFTGNNISNVSLSVKLIKNLTKVSNDGDNLILSWATATEVNNNYFIIERSLDNLVYEKIGVIKAVGNSMITNIYVFTDNNPLPEAYYRLTQVDYDGKFETFRPIFINLRTISKALVVYPNPASEKVSIINETFQNNFLQIINSVGQIVFTSEEIPKIELDVSNFVPGVYMVSNGNNLPIRLIVK